MPINTGMELLPAFGTDQLKRRPTWVRGQLLPGLGGRWVNKATAPPRHYAYLTLEKPEGFEVNERISCHQFAQRIGWVQQRVSWGDTFEVYDGRRNEPAFYVTLTASNDAARAEQRTRFAVSRREGTEVRTRVYELLAAETVARVAS